MKSSVSEKELVKIAKIASERGDYFSALLAAAADETEGDLKKAFKIADKCYSKSKFAKAGSPEDCGHDDDGSFSNGNDCASADYEDKSINIAKQELLEAVADNNKQLIKHIGQRFGMPYPGEGKTYKDHAYDLIDHLDRLQYENVAHSIKAHKEAKRKADRFLEWEADLPKYSIKDLESELKEHRLKGRSIQAENIEQELKRRKSKFAKAGSSEDCGHEVARAPRAGKFSEGNTCAGEGGGVATKEKPDKSDPVYRERRNLHKSVAKEFAEAWDSGRTYHARNVLSRHIRSNVLDDYDLSDLGEYIHKHVNNEEAFQFARRSLKEAKKVVSGEPGESMRLEQRSDEIERRKTQESRIKRSASGRKYLFGIYTDEKKLAEHTKAIFGESKSVDDLLDMVGFGPLYDKFSDLSPIISSRFDRIRINEITSDHSVNIERYIEKNEKGELYTHNEHFILSKEHQGQGLGIKVFTDQVDSSIKNGIHHISTRAGRGLDMNGYVTWPLFGYNGEVPYDIRRNYSGEISYFTGMDIDDVEDMQQEKPMQVHELLGTEKGRKFWTEKGRTFDAKFDLSKGSVSRRVLSEYRKHRKIDDPEGPNRFQRRNVWHAKRKKRSSGQSSSSSRPSLTSKINEFSRISGIGLVESSTRTGRNVERFSKEYHEGGKKISSSKKTLSAREVGEILADQHFNEPENFTPEKMMKMWVSSSKFRLAKIPLWSVGTYKDIKSNDKSHSTGPIIVDKIKTPPRNRYGSFGSLDSSIIIDGKHRRADAIEEGKTHLEAFIGEDIYNDLISHIKEFTPKRDRFIKALSRYYSQNDSAGLFEVADECGLTRSQIVDLISNNKKSIIFDPELGEFISKDSERRKTFFAKAGSSEK